MSDPTSAYVYPLSERTLHVGSYVGLCVTDVGSFVNMVLYMSGPMSAYVHPMSDPM